MFVGTGYYSYHVVLSLLGEKVIFCCAVTAFVVNISLFLKCDGV